MTAGGVIRGVLVAGLLGICPAVHAQTTVSAAIESDYRFRGISLSDGKPDVRFNIGYDHKSGAYAGLSREEVVALDTPQNAIFRLDGGVIERLACDPVAEPA